MSIAEFLPGSVRAENRAARPGQVAFELFINASLKYPASVTTQAAFLTVQARQNSYELETLRLALFNSDDRVKQIIRAGNTRHQKHERDVKKLTPARVREIINLDFHKAGDFNMTLTNEQLREIQDEMYPYYFARKNEFPEDLISVTTDRMMRNLSLVRPWRESNPQP